MAQSGKSNNSEIALAKRKKEKKTSHFCEHRNQIKCIIFIYFPDSISSCPITIIYGIFNLSAYLNFDFILHFFQHFKHLFVP